MTEKYPAMDVDIIVNGLCKSLIIELSSYQTTLNLPDLENSLNPTEITELWHEEKTIIGNNKLIIDLEQATTKLFSFGKKSD